MSNIAVDGGIKNLTGAEDNDYVIQWDVIWWFLICLFYYMKESVKDLQYDMQLCGGVKFSINGDPTDIYQCHCSVCRKVTGSTGISVFIAFGDNYKWEQGKDLIKMHVTPSGYRSVFCSECESELPEGSNFCENAEGSLI